MLKFNLILYVTTLALCGALQECNAMGDDEAQNEKNHFYQKTLLIYSHSNKENLSNNKKKPLLTKQPLQHINKEELYFKRCNSDLILKKETKKNIYSIDIENIYPNLLYVICHYLAPIDIVHLSATSQSLKRKITNRLWENYLRNHKQKSWNVSVPPVKVAFAYSLFSEGKINEAARLGLPEALKILKEEKKKTNKNKRLPSTVYVINEPIKKTKYVISPCFLCIFGFPYYAKVTDH